LGQKRGVEGHGKTRDSSLPPPCLRPHLACAPAATVALKGTALIADSTSAMAAIVLLLPALLFVIRKVCASAYVSFPSETEPSKAWAQGRRSQQGVSFLAHAHVDPLACPLALVMLVGVGCPILTVSLKIIRTCGIAPCLCSPSRAGITQEENDLVVRYGTPYRVYQRLVPALVHPLLGGRLGLRTAAACAAVARFVARGCRRAPSDDFWAATKSVPLSPPL